MQQNLIGGIFSVFASHNKGPKARDLKTRMRINLTLARDYLWSYFQARRQPATFQNVRSYCLFVGHARSGGSLIGGLLDAHPNIILADEVDIFPYVAARFSREQIFHLLLARSRIQARKGRTKDGRDAKTYSYGVPGQWQGRYENLQVIGSRKAGITTQQLQIDPSLLPRLRGLLGEDIAIKTILTIRNPFDTISTMHIRSGRPLMQGLEQYFLNCRTIESLKKGFSASSFLMLRHEDLLARPEEHIREACRFLDIPAPDEYIQACTAILYEAPAKSRHKVAWTPEIIATVNQRIGQYDFLKGYSFKS